MKRLSFLLRTCLVFKESCERDFSLGATDEPVVGRTQENVLGGAHASRRAGSGRSSGGADRSRTGDPRLAKPVLSQLSYSPDVATAVAVGISGAR